MEGPYGGVKRFPLKPGFESNAVHCADHVGPTFGSGNDLSCIGSITARVPFGAKSVAHPGRSYQDVVGMGELSFAGRKYYVPVEVEVFSVIPRSSS